MPKRKVQVDAELPEAKHSKQELFNVIQYSFSHLTPSDILAAIRVCKDWREFILQNISQWCYNLVQRKIGFLPGDSSLELQKRNCVFQLYELYKRKLIDAASYGKYKAELGFSETYLSRKHAELFLTPGGGTFAYILHEEDNNSVDFVGIERHGGSINRFSDVWYANLKSVTEEFQILLIHTYQPGWNKLHIVYTLRYELSLIVLQRCADVFKWEGVAAPWGPIDPDYLWSVMPFLKRKYSGDLNLQLYFIFIPNNVPHYFPLLLKWCASEEGAQQLFKQYVGGLSDEDIAKLADVMPRKYLKKKLCKPARHSQFAKLANSRGLSTRSTWRFCFYQAEKSNWQIPVDTCVALFYLVQTRQALVALKHYIKEKWCDGTHAYRKHRFHATYMRGEFIFDNVRVNATSDDVFECFQPLLPIHKHSVSWHILLGFYPGQDLPSVFSETTGDQIELRKNQEQVLRERYPAQ